MVRTSLVIIGAGGFGREAADVVEAVNSAAPTALWDLVGIYDDNPSKKNLARLQSRGIPYLGPLPNSVSSINAHYIIGVGSPSIRRKIASKLEKIGWNPVVLIHPRASVGSDLTIGPGSVVCSGVQISTNVQLGKHVHLNPNSTIGHDAVLGNFVSINPGAIVSGDVSIHSEALIGAGATVLQQVQIGAKATVGAQACVIKDVQDLTTVAGVPAKTLKGGTPA